MRAVVTGGAGFIGSHLIEALLARGDDVVCLERPGAPTGWVRELRIEYADAGIGDPDRLARTLAGADVVFHLAGLTAALRPAQFYAVNTDGTAQVFRAAARQGSAAPRVLLMSSLAAIGPSRNGESLSPDTVPYPISHYGRSKLLAEAVAHAYADRVPATIMRLTSVYGPREQGVLTLFKLVRRGVAFTVGGWDREVSLIYVRDAVQGLIAAATTPIAAGRTYCLAHPQPVTWRGFAHLVGDAFGKRPYLVNLPVALARLVAVSAEGCALLRRRAAVLNRDRLRELTQTRWVCDPSRAIVEIGFRPLYPAARGVSETAAWYREARWL